MCSEEVKRNIRIAANAKRKQELFNLLELLLQLKDINSKITELEQGKDTALVHRHIRIETNKPHLFQASSPSLIFN